MGCTIFFVMTLSTWELFDRMQLCYTIRIQLRHIYRTGSFRNCEMERKDFMKKILEKIEKTKEIPKETKRPTIGVIWVFIVINNRKNCDIN